MFIFANHLDLISVNQRLLYLFCLKQRGNGVYVKSDRVANNAGIHVKVLSFQKKGKIKRSYSFTIGSCVKN